jgi:3-hydroxyacyl-[acyl-carrier-protein] dehydratase
LEYETLLRKYRKRLLAGPEDMEYKLDCRAESIERIIPHREPFLLIDRLTGVDFTSGIITGLRTVGADEPVFRGHFPDYPVYPGVLQQEMIGQLGLCLHYFIENQVTDIKPEAKPIPIRATRVLGALYLEPILPDSEVLLIAKKLDFDGFLARIIGQAVVNQKVCCVTISEGYLIELSA